MNLHPQAAALVEAMQQQNAPSIPESTPEEARAVMGPLKEILGDGPEIGSVREITIPVDGAEIGAIVYDPLDDPIGVIVYFHGGGWVVGSASDWEAMYRKLVVSSGCRLVSVDYRLAPEHPFPVGVEDAYAALRWSAGHLADGRPIVVAGDSSGGNLAAVCARRARDAEEPELALQLLIYPVTDHDFTRPSYAEHGDSGLLLSRADMEWFWNHYVPDVAARSDPDASPLRAGSLADLPPAYVVIAEFDPLRDEGLSYAARLEADGVPVTLDHVRDQLHGFFTMVNLLESGDQAVDRVGRAIRDAC
jgi:acetyl esterase